MIGGNIILPDAWKSKACLQIPFAENEKCKRNSKQKLSTHELETKLFSIVFLFRVSFCLGVIAENERLTLRVEIVIRLSQIHLSIQSL